jgi:hypothetical protein
LTQRVSRASTAGVARGAIGDQSDASSRELAKVVGLQHVDARHHLLASAARGGARHLGNAPQHGQDVALAIRMEAVGEHDQECLGLRIDPDCRAGVAGMAVGARREGGREPDRVGRIDVPAQAAQGGTAGRTLRRRHRRDRSGLQHVLAACQHHLGEPGEVFGRGECAGMACHPAHAIGDGILHLAPAQLAALDVGGRDAIPERGRGQERRVAHAERLEDVLGRVHVQRLARDATDQLAQHDEVDIAVDEARAWRRHRLQRRNGIERPLAVRPAARREAGGQSGVMGHHLAHGDGVLAVGAEGRPVGCDRLVETDLAAFDQLHDGDGGRHHLGQRCRVVDGIERRGLHVGHHRALAVGLAQHDAIADAEHDDATDQMPRRDLLVDDAGDLLRGLTCGRCLGRRRGCRRRRCRTGDDRLAEQADKEEGIARTTAPRP